jgi:hypothetical protein
MRSHHYLRYVILAMASAMRTSSGPCAMCRASRVAAPSGVSRGSITSCTPGLATHPVVGEQRLEAGGEAAGTTAAPGAAPAANAPTATVRAGAKHVAPRAENNGKHAGDVENCLRLYMGWGGRGGWGWGGGDALCPTTALPGNVPLACGLQTRVGERGRCEEWARTRGRHRDAARGPQQAVEAGERRPCSELRHSIPQKLCHLVLELGFRVLHRDEGGTKRVGW